MALTPAEGVAVVVAETQVGGGMRTHDGALFLPQGVAVTLGDSAGASSQQTYGVAYDPQGPRNSRSRSARRAARTSSMSGSAMSILS